MPSFSVLPGSEGFLFLGPALVSQPQTRFPKQPREPLLKDQRMLRLPVLIPALAASLTVSAAAQTTSFTEPFSSDPGQHGWRITGDSSLFQWDSTNQNLRMTWDSSRENSYFYYSLGTILTRGDDFSFAFDLQLIDIGAGLDASKNSTFEIAIGFLNLDLATQTNFLRGTGVNSPDVAELDYFWDSGFGATVSPTLVDTNSTFNYVSSSDYAIFALSPGDWYHIVMSYAASNQAVVTTVTNFEQTSGVRINQSINTTNFADFRLGTFSISSYSDAGQDPQYAGSVLAHGLIDNVMVTVPAPPLQTVLGSLTNGDWRAEFVGRTNWLYTLERTADFKSWSAVSPPTAGQTGVMSLSDTNPATSGNCYRIRASRP